MKKSNIKRYGIEAAVVISIMESCIRKGQPPKYVTGVIYWYYAEQV
jgi:hypothetical protein